MRAKKLQQAVALILMVSLMSLVAAEFSKEAEACVPIWLARKAFDAGSAPIAKRILEGYGYVVFEKPWYVPLPKVIWYVLTAARPVY